jgi:hypothetical protein
MAQGSETLNALIGTGQAAGADLSSSQYRLVKTPVAPVVVTTAATDVVLGVLQNKPTAGQACDIKWIGVTKLLAGGTITAGIWLMNDDADDGAAIAWTTGNVPVGISLTAGVDGGLITALIIPQCLA